MTTNQKCTLHSEVGFYFGDPGYMMDYDVYMEMLEAGGEEYADGARTIKGYTCVYASTMYGDGEYNGFSVDGGILGCIPYELLAQPVSIPNCNDYGAFVEGDTAEFESNTRGEFLLSVYKDSKLVKTFSVSTNEEAEEEDDYWDLDDEEEEEELTLDDEDFDEALNWPNVGGLIDNSK